MKFTSMLSVFFLVNVAVGKSVAVADSATTRVEVSGNLDPATAIQELPSSFADYGTINKLAQLQLPIVVYDSLGREHVILMAFFHVQSNGWRIICFTDGGKVSKTPGVPFEIAYGDYYSPLYGLPALTKFSAIIPWSGAKRVNTWFDVYFSSFDNRTSAESIVTTNNTNSSVCLKEQVSDRIISSDQLIMRAISSKKCDTRKFSSNKECQRCYNLAAAPFKQKFDQELFQGLLSRSAYVIGILKDYRCAAFK